MTKQEELLKRINQLPKGGITFKKISGKSYAYYQWTENGKQRSRRVKDNELNSLADLIAERKRLQSELRELTASRFSYDFSFAWERSQPYGFPMVTRLGNELRKFSSEAKKMRKRESFDVLHDYVYGDLRGKVLILYGLRRTGKTTMIMQLIAEMDDETIGKTAFIQAMPKNTMADLNVSLKALEEQGYRIVFIDEVTLIEDFVEGAALLSDIFAASGMKIVLSGTDSLGFMFSEDEQLFDRCIMIHTTSIPYREFSRVLGIDGVDEYIEYGGTMSMSGEKYSGDTPFATPKTTGEYVDSAIARNIQHSLKCYQRGGRFRSLWELYDNNELTSVINRVVEDINHRFTLEVLVRDFKSTDLAISAGNLRRDRSKPNDVLDKVNVEEITRKLKSLLEIKNRKEQRVGLNDVHVDEIKEYLEILDLIVDLDVVSARTFALSGKRVAVTQPGLRYAQAHALVKSLIADPVFKGLSIKERNYVTGRILNEIKGRMLEDIVLFETREAPRVRERNGDVFKLEFPVGEFDMVVSYPDEEICEVYEIKHSSEINKMQYRHLINEKKCALVEHRYGEIIGKYVIYRGENTAVEGIEYLNVEEYLKGLGSLGVCASDLGYRPDGSE